MLAIKLHKSPRPSLAKGECLIPIIDWRSGRVQVGREQRNFKRYRYITLARIPDAGCTNLIGWLKF